MQISILMEFYSKAPFRMCISRSKLCYMRLKKLAELRAYLKVEIRIILGSSGLIVRAICLFVSTPKYSKPAISR